MKVHITRRAVAAAFVATATLLTAACGSSDTGAATSASSSASADSHITRDGAKFTPENAPTRIAAISPDAAETVAALGLGDRLVMVPTSQKSSGLTAHPDVMAKVEHVVAPFGTPDPEQILAASPDLVIITPRHNGEQDSANLLGKARIPVLTLPTTWQNIEETAENIRIIGRALHAEGAAADLANRISTGTAPQPQSKRHSVLVLSNQAGRPMVNAGRNFTISLLTRAGGDSAASRANVTTTGFADPEKVAAMEPDAIILSDITGRGQPSFDSVLKNPAVAALPAVQQGRVLLIDGRKTQAYGLTSVVDGFTEIHQWLSRLP